jgi:hypothetical protein
MAENLTEDELNLEDVIKELEDIDYTTVAEKAEQQFDKFYTMFGANFAEEAAKHDTPDETRREMIISTYNLSIQSLNTALNYIEYAYTLSLSIQKKLEEHDMTFTLPTLKAMDITNNFLKEVASNINLTLSSDLIPLLNDLKEEDSSNE